MMIRCPNCRSPKTRKHGFVLTQKDGEKRRMFCCKCATTFYPDPQRLDEKQK